MYKRIQQIIAMVMAVLVLASTLSISIEKHYCGDHLVDIAILSEAQKCGMETTEEGAERMDMGTSLEKTSCCKDVVDLVEGQDELTLGKKGIQSKSQKQVAYTPVLDFEKLTEPLVERGPPFQHYSPPYFVRDIHVLHEVFLI